MYICALIYGNVMPTVHTRSIKFRLKKVIKKSVFSGLMLAVLSLLYISCDDTSTIGFPIGESKIRTVFLDTFTVKTSTVLLDSIATSNNNRLLIGNYQDAIFGKTSASAIFQVGSTNVSSFTPLATSVFDSLSLVLKYDKYVYGGDTTQVQNISAYALNQNIISRIPNQYILADVIFSYFYATSGAYNRSITNSSSTVMGSLNFRPLPRRGDKIYIKLDPIKGKEWFDIAQGENKSQLTADNFLQLFKGLKLSSTTAQGSVLGFVTDSTKMRFYYREPDGEGVFQKKYFDFLVYNRGLQYNQVIADRTGTPLANLVTNVSVGSDKTNNETFIQGGAGVATRIDFPSFKNLNSNDAKFTVLSARLVIIPVNASDNLKPLPATLGLIYVNDANIPSKAVPLDFDFNGSTVQSAGLFQDNEYNRKTEYSFSLTQYVETLINRQASSTSLLLTLPYAPFTSSVAQLRIGNGLNQTSRIKLEIYLSRLNN